MEQLEMDEVKLDSMLKAAYGRGTVPEDVNIRVRNQLKTKEAAKGISFWWLPACFSTVLAVVGFVLASVLYLVINLGGNIIMPNLVHMLTTGILKLELFGMFVQITISWTVTGIGLWKTKFYQSARFD